MTSQNLLSAAESSEGQQINAAELMRAFAEFSRASEELSLAYSGLQSQMVQLGERLDVLMGALPVGVAVLDKNGVVIQANVAAESLFGLALSGLTWVNLCSQLRATAQAGEFEIGLDRDVHRLAVGLTPLQSGDGNIVLLHDITEQHRMRQQASRNERLAAMGEMVAGLAHQLRTPLAAALLYVGNLQKSGLSEEDRSRVVDRTTERLHHLERLIRDMLRFAKGEQADREIFGTCEFADEMAQLSRALAEAKNIQFNYACRCQQRYLHADRKAMQGALTNLLENALQFTAAGRSINLTVVEQDGLIRFAVRDTGRGMDADLQARIFQPFFTTRMDGTGLGLAIARDVARANGGDIQLHWSAPGEGTEFVLLLPFIESTGEVES